MRPVRTLQRRATRVRGAISPGRRDENTQGRVPSPVSRAMEPVLEATPQPTAPPRTCRSTRREGDSTLAGGTIPPDKTHGTRGTLRPRARSRRGKKRRGRGRRRVRVRRRARERARPRDRGATRSATLGGEGVRESSRGARGARRRRVRARVDARIRTGGASRGWGRASSREGGGTRGVSRPNRGAGRGEARGNAPREGGEGGGEGGEGGGRAEGKGGARRENHGGESVVENRQTRREPGIRGAHWRGRRCRRRARPTAERGRRR